MQCPVYEWISKYVTELVKFAFIIALFLSFVEIWDVEILFASLDDSTTPLVVMILHLYTVEFLDFHL